MNYVTDVNELVTIYVSSTRSQLRVATKEGIERIHIEPYDMVGYVQEASRAGPGGAIVEAAILMDEEQNLILTPKISLTEDEVVLQEYMTAV